MQPFQVWHSLLAVAAVGWWSSGCATHDVNPPQARGNTGYVDFHTDAAESLSWEVALFDRRTQEFQRVYSELDPLPGRVLRLAFPPGPLRLRVTFLNRVVQEPVVVDVELADGMVAPVHVVLTAAGTNQVERKDERRGGTYRGRYGRGIQYGSDESVSYRVSAEAQTPVPYQVKERMPYAR